MSRILQTVVAFLPYAYRMLFRKGTYGRILIHTATQLDDLDFDLGSGHTAYLRVSLIDLCLHSKFR